MLTIVLGNCNNSDHKQVIKTYIEETSILKARTQILQPIYCKQLFKQ